MNHVGFDSLRLDEVTLKPCEWEESVVCWVWDDSSPVGQVRGSLLEEAPPSSGSFDRSEELCSSRLLLPRRRAQTKPRPDAGFFWLICLNMSTLASESAFLSALQPNNSVTTYALPPDIQLGSSGGSVSDEVSRARRVQQQIQMRLSEKSTLPRQNGSSSHYAMSGKQPPSVRLEEELSSWRFSFGPAARVGAEVELFPQVRCRCLCDWEPSQGARYWTYKQLVLFMLNVLICK